MLIRKERTAHLYPDLSKLRCHRVANKMAVETMFSDVMCHSLMDYGLHKSYLMVPINSDEPQIRRPARLLGHERQ